MKKLSKLDLAAKVKILNENDIKHLKGGYGGSCSALVHILHVIQVM